MQQKARRERLTPQRIAAFEYSGKLQSYLWDTESPRLAVRVTSGSKSFVFEGKLKRVNIRITIGDVRNWSIEEARVQARLYQTTIDKGIDPRDQAREQAEARVAAKEKRNSDHEAEKKLDAFKRTYTLQKLCEAYSALLAARGKPKSASQAKSIFKCHLSVPHPNFASMAAKDITPIQVATMVRSVTEKGFERSAGVLRSLLSAAYNCAYKAATDARIPSSFIEFGVTSNPVESVATIPGKTSDRTLSIQELHGYICGMDDSLHDQALKLAIYSGGQRMAQLLRVKVSDYDEASQTIRLIDGKGKRAKPREHLVPLGLVGQGIVAKLAKRAVEIGSPYLFSVIGNTKPITETAPGKRLVEIREAIGVQKFDLRDIRRTVETMMAALRISKDIRAQLLSHGISGVQDFNYDRYEYIDEKREAITLWEKRLEQIRTGATQDNVVPMPAKKKIGSSSKL